MMLMMQKGCYYLQIQDDDPVIFMEHKRLYMKKCDVPENMDPIPLGKGRIRRQEMMLLS